MKTWLALFLCCASGVHAADFPPAEVGRSTVQFTRLPQQAEPEKMKWRLHSVENPGAFDPAKDKFQILVPATYRHSEQWGVFIWISPADAPTIPAEWDAILAARKLIFVGAFKAGNPRNIFDRMRLALTANTGMRGRFNVDSRRVYVSGFSGGARVASMLDVAYADMFTGALPFMGVNFYEDIMLADGKTKQGADFIPDAEVLAIARKSCRYALMTGETDFNRPGTKAVFEQGYRKQGFANVQYLEAPGVGHAMPPAAWLERGLDFLDAGKGVIPILTK
jgi:hypothetical protein